MAESVIDWKTATIKVSVDVHHTATTDRQEVEIPLAAFASMTPRSKTLPVVPVEERLERLEAALAAAVTALELIIDGETTQSAEELVEILLYPEHFNLAERMRDVKALYERIDIARGKAVLGQ